VLLLWRDQIRIVLCKDRVLVLHLQGRASKRVTSKLIIPYVGTDTGWRPVLALLQSRLQNAEFKNADVTVILSNHFARFLVLPWNDAHLTNAEKMALVQHRFAEVYGESSEQWVCRLSEESYGAQSIASAIPQQLLNSLSTFFNTTTLRLSSVQPYLMTAFNECRAELGNEEGWFLLAERDTFCIGLVQGGQWASIRLRRVATDWFEEAMLLLEREALLISSGINIHKVFVYAPESPSQLALKHGIWSIQRLQSRSVPALAAPDMTNYAMAVAGL
jgi:hypothetical protein